MRLALPLAFMMQTSPKFRYAVRLGYHGSPFSGWQVQPEQRTVQGELESALSALTKETVRLHGAGRTDTGVHALNYVAHFETDQAIDVDEVVFRLQKFLPKKLTIYEMCEVTDRFHARFSATSRAYRYTIRRRPHPFDNDLVWNDTREMDFDMLQRAAQTLLNNQEYAAFARSGGNQNGTDCTIFHAEWRQDGDLWIFEVRGNRFLRNMVRALVGTMVELAMGKRTWEEWEALLQGGTRSDAGQSAPASGLVFAGVSYENSPFNDRERGGF